MQRFLALLFCGLIAGNGYAASALEQLQNLVSQQQYQQAARHGEQMLRDLPQHNKTRFLTAYAYQMSQQTAKAKALYQALIADRPELPEPRNNLAMIYLAEGDYDRAQQLLVEAIQTHPSYATAYQNLSDIYKGIASEAYRRAVSESSEPSQSAFKIELSAITNLDSIEQGLAEATDQAEPTLVNFANQETLLIEQVKAWAEAWSSKDFPAYVAFYAPQFRAKFDSREQWLAQRRARIVRPDQIQVGVSDIQIRWRSENRAIIDFKQAFDSARYSDRVVKRLAFNRVGTQWKITEERVLSVL